MTDKEKKQNRILLWVCIAISLLIGGISVMNNDGEDISNTDISTIQEANKPKDISWIYGDWSNDDGLHFCVSSTEKCRFVLYDFTEWGRANSQYGSGKILDIVFDEFIIEDLFNEGFDIIYLYNEGMAIEDCPKLRVDYENKCLREYKDGTPLKKYKYEPFLM